MNDERERPAATDVRSRVIADCAALLPLARSACAAMDEGDESEVLRLFCGESQKKTLRRLGRLIDDLRLCRTAEDLPGPDAEPTNRRIRGKSNKPRVRQHAQGQIQQKQKQNINLSHPQRWSVPIWFQSTV